MQISQYHLAQAIGVPPRRINEIVHGKRGITADTALRLGRFFGMEAQFWMNLQTRYDLETTREALATDSAEPCHVTSNAYPRASGDLRHEWDAFCSGDTHPA